MKRVLTQWAAMRGRPVAGLAPRDARDMPTLQDAARALPNVHGLPAPATPIGAYETLTATGAAGPLEARLYRPVPMRHGAKMLPVIVYFAGGTWVNGSLSGYDETARQLMVRTGWLVVAIRTRLAPEAQFPEGQEDALAAYTWALQAMRSWGGDPGRVVLAGEGAGANLAVDTALAARSNQLAAPGGLLLITPLASTSLSGASMRENGKSRPLTRGTVDWAQDLYTRRHRDLDDVRLNPALSKELGGLPPTTVVMAEIDPLRTEGEEMSAALRAAHVPTQSRIFPSVTHDFFGLGLVVPEAAVAEAYAADQLRAVFRPAVLMPASRAATRRMRHSRMHRGGRR